MSDLVPYNCGTTVPFDDQIRDALGRATEALRAHLEADLAAFTDELARLAAAERAHAAHQAAEAA
jgi:hypothetical protein